jgi:hypothetical protein
MSDGHSIVRFLQVLFLPCQGGQEGDDLKESECKVKPGMVVILP